MLSKIIRFILGTLILPLVIISIVIKSSVKFFLETEHTVKSFIPTQIRMYKNKRR